MQYKEIEYTKEQEDLIFHLYIIEHGLDDTTIEAYRLHEKTKDALTGLTNEQIRTIADQTAKRMNQEIGVDIY